VKGTSSEANHYAVFSSLLPPPPSSYRFPSLVIKRSRITNVRSVNMVHGTS